MPRDPKELKPGLPFARDFILSKAHTASKPACASAVETDENNGLLSAYPHLLKGKSLMVRAMNLLENAQLFGTAVVQIDGSQAGPDSSCESVSGEFKVLVARAIENACRSVDGLWGLLDNAAFGCFFPACNQTEVMDKIEAVKSVTSAGNGPTVTVGIAVFPTLEYPKDRIIDNAVKALEHAKFFGPDSLVCFDAISLNISGDRRYDAGDYQGAIDEFNTAILMDAQNANLHNSLGVCYGVTGEFTKALDHFTVAITLDPHEALAYYNAGLVHLLAGDRDKAVARLFEAEKCPQQLHEVALQLGRLYLEDNDLDSSMTYLEKAADMQPQSSQVHSLMGDCFTALGQTEEAAAAYKKALRLNANDAASLSGLGWLYNSMDKNAEIAKSFCRHSTEISPQNGLFRYRLGRLYYKEGRFKEAKQEFETALDLGYEPSSAYLEKTETRLLDKAS